MRAGAKASKPAIASNSSPNSGSNQPRSSLSAPSTPTKTPGIAAAANGSALRRSTRRCRRYATVPLHAFAQTTASENAVTADQRAERAEYDAEQHQRQVSRPERVDEHGAR